MDTLFQPRKIFILDDSEADREIFRRFLARAAPAGTYHCTGHETLSGALDRVRTEKPDCILLDYRLQDGTGVDFLHELRSNEGSSEFAVVMLTGAGSEFVAAESIKTGAQEYLSKDLLTPEQLCHTVESAISAARARHAHDTQRRETERRLRESEEENARRERFLASLSHRLRTPLTPMVIAASVLRDRYDHSEEVKKIAALILENAQQQAGVIDEMLGPVIPKVYGA